MKRIAYFLVTVLLLNFSWALLNPAAARSQFVPLSPLFTEMSPGIFVESGPVSEADIAARLDLARRRVNDWFGSSSATPNLHARRYRCYHVQVSEGGAADRENVAAHAIPTHEVVATPE
ncbi:MAG: hypothetical protein AAGL66_14310, partial [Pseudomonadota bacterium]